MSSNGSTHKPSDGALQQQNFKSSSLPGSPRMPASPANSVPSSSSSTGGGGIKVKIKRTSSTDSRHTSNNSNGNKANFLDDISESPGSASSLMEFSIDTEMSCLSNSTSSNSKPDNGVSQPTKHEGGMTNASGKCSNVLKRHLDGYPTNAANPQTNYPALQPNSNLTNLKREPPLKKTKINGGSGDELLNGDCQKGASKASTQQNKTLLSSSDSSQLNKMVISSDASSHNSSNSAEKLALQNGINTEGNNLNDSSFTPSVLNYALTSTSSPSSQTSSIPESELVLDSSSGLLIKKSDEIRNSDSPILNLNGANSNEIGTMTDPDSLGPCEPGTAVKLQGIVWQETDKGLLVLNVTWKNKTFMGTLLDCHRQSDSHKWAGPKDPQSLSKKGKRGRGSRSRTPPVKHIDLSKKKKNKLLPGTTSNRNNGSIPESPLSKDSINNRRRLPPVNYGESDDEDIMPKDDESGDETTNPPNESLSPSSRLIECPKPQCFKKFRDLDALKYHLSYTHNDLKDDKPPNKKLKKRKKLLAKRKREANAKEITKTEKNVVKKEPDTSLPESISKYDDTHIKKEIKSESNDTSKQHSSKMLQNGSDFNSLDNIKSETLSKHSSNAPSSSALYSAHYSIHGNNSNPQPLALTSASSSVLPLNSNHFNNPGIGSSNLKISSSQHNINYLMSNPQQQPLNFESQKNQGSHYQPPPAHGGSNHSSPLIQNGTRGPLSMGKDLDGRLSSFAQNGSNDLRATSYQPSPINLGSSKESLTNKSQNPVQLQRQRSSGGPASPAYSDISDEESTTVPTSNSASSGNGTSSSSKMALNRGLHLGSNQSLSQARPPISDQSRKSSLQNESTRASASQLQTAGERKTDGTKPTTQTIGPPPQHLPPELHGGSLAFPPHLAHGLAGLPPGFPPHLMASLAASMGAAATAGGHRFPSPIPPIPGMPGTSTKALDILQQHANQYIATSKLQELQDRAGQGKTTNSGLTPSSSSVPKSTSPSMTNLLGVNRGNVATASPPLLRHEHNHTHLHLGYPPPGFSTPTGLSGTPPVGPGSVTLPPVSNSSSASSLRGVAPPSGSITVPGSPSPSHLPQPSPSSLMSGLFGSGSPGSGHNLRLSSAAFPPK